MELPIVQTDLRLHMDFIFNEFSFRDVFPNQHEGRIGMGNLLKVCKLGREHGMSRLAIRPDFYEQFLAQEYSITDWLKDQEVNKTFKDLLFSIVRQPYIDNNDAAIEERFIMSNTFLVDETMSKPEGLAIAYLYSTMSVSLASSEKWNVDEVSLKFSEEGYEDLLVTVKHASQALHVEGHKDWIASRIGIKLKTTDLPLGQKEIRLRDDHGKDVLLRFAKKLVWSPYIIKVINSLPFNPHDHHFIRHCYEDGRIEIVLVRTDQGLGLVVQTTGRNMVETEAIAKILDEEFDEGY